jgi:hypothetical protein
MAGLFGRTYRAEALSGDGSIFPVPAPRLHGTRSACILVESSIQPVPLRISMVALRWRVKKNRDLVAPALRASTKVFYLSHSGKWCWWVEDAIVTGEFGLSVL